ncbi:MBL fold metallo-hydrolase [Nocardia cyriacigeorgica]|nr:MBL fold metallo-hydrolase [Nocardia cyriacigeorgica]
MSRRMMLGGALGAGALVALGAGAAAGAEPRTVAARQRFFGGDVVDPMTGAVRADRVVLSWVGCATYAVAFAGTVVLLDAWVPRLSSAGYVPATAQDLADLQPAAILIGHGHFDHAGDAGRIAQASGAVVHGTAEHCATIRAQVPDPGFGTIALGDAGTPPGHIHEFRIGDIEVTAVRHLHSGPTAPDPVNGSAPFFPVPDLCAITEHPPTLDDLRVGLPRLRDEEGGCLLYQLRAGGFSLVWHDSAGPLTEKAPHVFDVFAGLPPTDLQIGAIQGFNQLTNGLRDPRTYIEAIRPKIFVPAHHDNWLPGFTAPAATYDQPLRSELDRIPADRRPELHALLDPTDYIAPALLTFAL